MPPLAVSVKDGFVGEGDARDFGHHVRHKVGRGKQAPFQFFAALAAALTA